jgi:ferredoxin
VKVAVDRDLCTGHGRCYSLAPRVFTDDDGGYGQVTGDGTLPDDLAEEAHSGANSCPEQAISVTVRPVEPRRR